MAYAKQQRKKGTLTKDEIVQCAFNLIANKGTEGCSMRALGNELGVSAMALYGYIPSRESLLNEVGERFLKTVDTRALHRPLPACVPLRLARCANFGVHAMRSP